MKNHNIKNFYTKFYEAPAVNVVELETEGVLCASGQNEEWNEGTLPE